MDWQKLLSSKRPRGTTIPKDHRAEFERDYDRAVFSTPVKRLQDKAQVFPLDPCDSVRTRLTHSLEVSSVARGLATSIAKWLLAKNHIIPGQDRAIEAICATAGLIHDLGNPPFGHAGETAISSWFEKNAERLDLRASLKQDEQLIQDFLKFEGNAQSIRLITKLQILSDFHGLNLTYGTLSACCKYIAQSNEANTSGSDHAYSKPGYFTSEADQIKCIQNETGTGKARNPLTFIIEAADDLVYAVADIEDGVKKNIITFESFRNQFDSQNCETSKAILTRFENILKAGRHEYPKDLPGDVLASAFRTATIGTLVPQIVDCFTSKYDSIMSGQFTNELVSVSAGNNVIKFLKKFGRTHIYNTPETLKLELLGRKIIHDLMDVFWDGARIFPLNDIPNSKTFPGKSASLFSSNYCKVFQHSVSPNLGYPEMYCRYQLLTDQICGMTDSYAKRLHAELTNGN